MVADAVTFTSTNASTPRTATWALPVPTLQTYDVYARWPADPGNATNAQYTVHYAGGTTMVTMNQTQNGGTWQLLGTFTLNPALNPKVELSDQANGTVVANAVMVVHSGTSSDRVTYTPTLPSAETVDIYAKWTESENRSETVTYTIHHSVGSTDIRVNQQQPSAGWFHLGAFAMAPGQNHRVEVYGALEGETVADAVRFVSAGVSAPGISYVHADHLGSPQKMTDATKAIVWDAVYTPFGQVHAITGTAMNNQRFPGQYADAETGYSYNYFRDYDPTTGRYIQNDPIGLDGGLNTFRYVGNRPLRFIDPMGLVTTNAGFFAIEGENTIVCNGNNGVRIHLSPNTNPERRRCGVRDCIQEHEKYHQANALRMSPNICHGQPDGLKVSPSDVSEQNTQEYIGNGIEVNCLINKLKNLECGCEEVLTKELEGVSNDQQGYRGKLPGAPPPIPR